MDKETHEVRECLSCKNFFGCEFKEAKKEGCIHYKEFKNERVTLLDYIDSITDNNSDISGLDMV